MNGKINNNNNDDKSPRYKCLGQSSMCMYYIMCVVHRVSHSVQLVLHLLQSLDRNLIPSLPDAVFAVYWTNLPRCEKRKIACIRCVAFFLSEIEENLMKPISVEQKQHTQKLNHNGQEKCTHGNIPGDSKNMHTIFWFTNSVPRHLENYELGSFCFSIRSF